MIKTIGDLLELYSDYKDPFGKIQRETKSGTLFSLVKGLYETDKNISGHYLSAYIYGPSYLSFEYALHYHGLIPEKVVVYTSATFNKKKSKKYHNHFGLYTYHDIPKTAFPYGVISYIDKGYSFIIASAEKALCDQLYISSPQTSMVALKKLMFYDLRIDEESFLNLNFDDLLFLCDKYRSNNLKLLKKIVKRRIY